MTFALVAATIAIAWRAEAATAARCRRPAVLVALVFADGRSTLDHRDARPAVGDRRRGAPSPARRLRHGTSRSASASRCCSAARASWRRAAPSARSCRCCGRRRRCSRRSRSWSRSITASPGFERSIPFAGVALLLAALFALATESAGQARAAAGLAAAGAIFATGAVAALALALTMALEKGWLTVALALMVPGIAWVADKRPLPALRWLAAVDRRPGDGAHRLGAAHRRQRRRHDADLQLAALRLRHSGRRVLARRPSAAPARRRRARAHGRFRGAPVHRAAGVPGDPPPDQQRRRLPRPGWPSSRCRSASGSP